MPYARHVYVQYNWTLPGGEVASCTTRHLPPELSPTPEELLAAANAVRVPTATFQAVTNSRMSTGVALTTVEVGTVGEDGTVTQRAVSTAAGPTAGTGGLLLPNQCSLVIGLLTPRAGRSYRGRLYLPTLGLAPGSDGRASSATVTSLLAVVRTWLEDVSTALTTTIGDGVSMALVVASSTRGENTVVNALRCGLVIDTQRRRRDTLPEAYVVSPGEV